MSCNINILMLGGAKRVSLGNLLKKAGHNFGKEVNIFSYEISPDVPIASIGKIIEGKRWKDPDIYRHLSETIRDCSIDIVLPFVDGAIEICSKLKPEHPDVFIPVSPFEAAHAMFDKKIAAELFAKNGFPIPATYESGECRFPAILKPRTGSASKGIRIVDNEDELSRIPDIDDYLIQEYIADRDEYTVDCYVSTISHNPVCIVPRLRISTSGGEVDRTITCRIPQLISQSEDIIRKLKFEGPVTIQFIHDRQRDRYLLMEINPRLGGGVVCSINAGADIATMIIEESLGRNAQPVYDWRDKALMARYFSEVMFYENEK